jgi:excisionase family DNA binding protein
MASKPKPKFKAYWTIKGIAEHLDVSERSVHRWIDSGDLVVCRFGKSVRIADGDLHAFLAQSRDV